MAKQSRGEKAKWKQISNRPDLSINFIIENKDLLDFKIVSRNIRINRYYIFNELEDYVDWTTILLYHREVLTDEDILNNTWRFNWRSISYSQDLSEDLIELIPNQLDWQVVIARHKYSEEFLLKYKDYLNWEQVIAMQSLSMEFLEEHAQMLIPHKYSIYMYQKFTEDFMRKYKDKLDWKLICMHQNLSLEFIEEMSDYVDWNWISIRQKKMNKDFIIKNKDKLNLAALLKRKIVLPKEIKNSDYAQVFRYYEKHFRAG
jgi:hypothetical protein